MTWFLVGVHMTTPVQVQAKSCRGEARDRVCCGHAVAVAVAVRCNRSPVPSPWQFNACYIARLRCCLQNRGVNRRTKGGGISIGGGSGSHIITSSGVGGGRCLHHLTTERVVIQDEEIPRHQHLTLLCHALCMHKDRNGRLGLEGV
jgi:hypothetical protein